ncbi:hypothetical protein ALC60_07922 [Trachymyrmex zeteki]|uniref:Uncharacterized protein n=1 Tax=Mycetomoellerius zeteki TaxID=64791 RepID=A0A151WZR2_9HYME|nr:hypothetical protein ALC60_07922 [Trachymyrmex zeteki]
MNNEGTEWRSLVNVMFEPSELQGLRRDKVHGPDIRPDSTHNQKQVSFPVDASKTAEREKDKLSCCFVRYAEHGSPQPQCADTGGNAKFEMRAMPNRVEGDIQA